MRSRYYLSLLSIGIFTTIMFTACGQASDEVGNVSNALPTATAMPATTDVPANSAQFSPSDKPATMEVKVFFSSGDGTDCSEVKAVTRTVPSTKGVARAALQELFKGPTEDAKRAGLSSFFSDETKDLLDGVNIKDGTAYVDLDEAVIQKLGNATTSCGSQAFTASVEETLKQFSTVKKVFYAIEGSPRDFYDWIQVGECPKELKNCDASNF